MEFEDENKKFYDEVLRVSRIIEEIHSGFSWMDCCPTKQVIYHYTSPLGLLGITSDNVKLWFSRYDFLNDKLEGQFVFKVYTETIKRLSYERTISKEFLNLIEGIGFKFIEKFQCKVEIDSPPKDIIDCYCLLEYQPFLCCFSTNWDSLPNWNYYSKDMSSRGYNIGFSTNELIKSVVSKGCFQLELKNIIYGEPILKKRISELVLSAYKRWEELGTDGVLHLVGEQLFEWLLTTKSSHFRHEQEVRAILKVPVSLPNVVKEEKLTIQYRAVDGYIVPYVSLEFDKKCVKQITIGPLLDFETAINGVSKMKEEKGYKNVRTKPSEIRLRY